MIIAFTGTRNGMTPQQKTAFWAVITNAPPSQFLHGACVGADEDAVMIVHKSSPSTFIIAYPGEFSDGRKNELRSEKAMAVSVGRAEPQSHFARNRKMVDAANKLIATPPCCPLPENGGTAYTINYAKKVGKPITIIWPNGVIAEWSSPH